MLNLLAIALNRYYDRLSCLELPLTPEQYKKFKQGKFIIPDDMSQFEKARLLELMEEIICTSRSRRVKEQAFKVYQKIIQMF